jgi:hypothetical protein
MKLLHITSVYPGYAESFYAARPELRSKSYEQQREAFFYDAFAWADAWKNALEPIGYEVQEVVLNVMPMQQAWARENLPRASGALDAGAIAVEQIRQFGPDVLWFDHHDAELLARIRTQIPTLKLVLGWVGSAMPRQNAFAHCDLILSCSRESVERLASLGHRGAELHHGFDARILSRLGQADRSFDFIFIGQLIRGSEFHLAREKLLEQVVEALPLKIFSPTASASSSRGTKRLVKASLAAAYRAMRAAGGGALAARLLRATGRSEEWLLPPPPLVNPKLAPYMAEGIYGLHMYETVRDARVTLNIHADSSDRYASNMRLFEVTGAGGCLLTDWKPNLSDMFSLDKEAVAYRSAAEAIEKARWLLQHPEARAAIALAGQARTLRDHTFSHRAGRFHEIVTNALRKVPSLA